MRIGEMRKTKSVRKDTDASIPSFCGRKLLNTIKGTHRRAVSVDADGSRFTGPLHTGGTIMLPPLRMPRRLEIISKPKESVPAFDPRKVTRHENPECDRKFSRACMPESEIVRSSGNSNPFPAHRLADIETELLILARAERTPAEPYPNKCVRPPMSFIPSVYHGEAVCDGKRLLIADGDEPIREEKFFPRLRESERVKTTISAEDEKYCRRLRESAYVKPAEQEQPYSATTAIENGDFEKLYWLSKHKNRKVRYASYGNKIRSAMAIDSAKRNNFLRCVACLTNAISEDDFLLCDHCCLGHNFAARTVGSPSSVFETPDSGKDGLTVLEEEELRDWSKDESKRRKARNKNQNTAEPTANVEPLQEIELAWILGSKYQGFTIKGSRAYRKAQRAAAQLAGRFIFGHPFKEIAAAVPSLSEKAAENFCKRAREDYFRIYVRRPMPAEARTALHDGLFLRLYPVAETRGYLTRAA
jgi:hypothetical protein